MYAQLCVQCTITLFQYSELFCVQCTARILCAHKNLWPKLHAYAKFSNRLNLIQLEFWFKTLRSRNFSSKLEILSKISQSRNFSSISIFVRAKPLSYISRNVTISSFACNIQYVYTTVYTHTPIKIIPYRKNFTTLNII